MHANPARGAIDRYVGGRLRRLRVNRGETASSLADLLGLAPAIVEQWELGTTRIPAVVLVELAGLLTCSVSYFFGSSEPQRLV